MYQKMTPFVSLLLAIVPAVYGAPNIASFPFPSALSSSLSSFLPADALLDPTLLLPARSTCSLLLPLLPSTPTSCGNTTVQNDLCCFNAPGGQFLQTQFWDWQSKLEWAGPTDSWTIHGLWPDHCDGSFDQFCDPSRESTNITGVLLDHGETKVLEYIHKYWKDNTGNDEVFWEHEWNKHGTCISSILPKCFKSYTPQLEIVAYIKRTILLFELLNSYKFLEKKGIVPSANVTYNLTDVTNALAAATGKTPTLGCNGSGSKYLHEVWYHFETKGSLVDGLFLPANPDGLKSSCASEIYYWPKGVPTPKPTASPTSTSTAPSPTSTEDKGTIQVYTSSGTNVGCILSKGTWSQQTCATFRPQSGSAPGTITLNHTKGPCAIDSTNGTLACGATVSVGSDFTNSSIAGGSLLAFNGETKFSADIVPTGNVQSTVWAGAEHPEVITLVYTRS